MNVLNKEGRAKDNPLRWLNPALPTSGTYRRDAEVAWIDALEEALPRPVPVLASIEAFNDSQDEVARIRVEIQVATQQCNAAYFENLETLLRNIGQLHRTRPVTWCGLGVLEHGEHGAVTVTPPYPLLLLDRRLDTISVLYAWLCGPLGAAGVAGYHPRCIYGQREIWIRATLGTPTQPKRWLVGHLCRIVKLGLRRPWSTKPEPDPGRYPLWVPFESHAEPTGDDLTVLEQLAANLEMSTAITRIRQELERLENELCHFRFDRWVDNLIMMIGTLDPDADHAPPELELTARGWVDQKVAWVEAMNAWIDETPVNEALRLPGIDPSIIRRIYAMLGRPSPVKVWLTASLSKTMRAFGEEHRPEKASPPQRFLRTTLS